VQSIDYPFCPQSLFASNCFLNAWRYKKASMETILTSKSKLDLSYHITHSPRLTSTNPVDDFFGSVSSRHDRRISVDVLPAYVEPPAYTWRDTEPITLAMYLFKFGFLFPPFWILGAIFLISPLRPPPSDQAGFPAWLPEKTTAERQKIIESLRKVELKWARRCLIALIGLLLVGVTIGLVAWGVLRARAV